MYKVMFSSDEIIKGHHSDPMTHPPPPWRDGRDVRHGQRDETHVGSKHSNVLGPLMVCQFGEADSYGDQYLHTCETGQGGKGRE